MIKDVSERTINILKEAGWYEGRKRDIEPIVGLLEERGFEVFPQAKEFLEEFGDLKFCVPDPYFENEIDKHTTEVIEIMGDMGDRDFVVPAEKYTGKKIVLVGEIENGHLQLMISELGKVYCDAGKLGDDCWEAWETIFDYTGKKKLIPWKKLIEQGEITKPW